MQQTQTHKDPNKGMQSQTQWVSQIKATRITIAEKYSQILQNSSYMLSAAMSELKCEVVGMP